MHGCFHHFLFLLPNLSTAYKEKSCQLSCPGKKDHEATPATLGEPAFLHFFLSYISLKMWRIVYEKRKVCKGDPSVGSTRSGRAFARVVTAQAKGVNIYDKVDSAVRVIARWQVACVQTSPISFVARGNKRNRRRLHAGKLASSPMLLFFPFLFPRPLHSRASPFAWLSRDFSRLPPNGELARRLHFTRDRFSPHKRGLEYRF